MQELQSQNIIDQEKTHGAPAELLVLHSEQEIPPLFYQNEVEEISNASSSPPHLCRAWFRMVSRMLIPHACHFPKKISRDEDATRVVPRLWAVDSYS